MFKKLFTLSLIALALLACRVSLADDVLSEDASDYAITIRLKNSGYELRFYGHLNAGFDFQTDLAKFDDVCSDCGEYGDERIVVYRKTVWMPMIIGSNCEALKGTFDSDEKVPFICKSEYISAIGETYETILEELTEGIDLMILFDTAEDNNTEYMDGHVLLLNGDANDTDKDGVMDDFDSCPDDWNTEADADNDGIDNACDPCPYQSINTCNDDADDDDDDDDSDVDYDDSDDIPDLGSWLAGDTTDGDSSSSDASSAGGGCAVVPSPGGGLCAYIMIALAMVPLALKRRE